MTVTALLGELAAGRQAAFGEILPLVYDELRRVAHRQLTASPSDTLCTTALVHELYLRLVEGVSLTCVP